MSRYSRLKCGRTCPREIWYNMDRMNEHLLNKDYRDMIVCLLQAGVDKRASGRPKDIVDALALEKLKARNGNG